MIIQHEIEINGIKYICTKSDKGLPLRQIETGQIYDEAVDVIPCIYTYEETELEQTNL